eukprot:6037078-Amphidinium_carterae.1
MFNTCGLVSSPFKTSPGHLVSRGLCKFLNLVAGADRQPSKRVKGLTPAPTSTCPLPVRGPAVRPRETL